MMKKFKDLKPGDKIKICGQEVVVKRVTVEIEFKRGEYIRGYLSNFPDTEIWGEE